MLSAICWICFGEWVRALRLNERSLSTLIYSILRFEPSCMERSLPMRLTGITRRLLEKQEGLFSMQRRPFAQASSEGYSLSRAGYQPLTRRDATLALSAGLPEQVAGGRQRAILLPHHA